MQNCDKKTKRRDQSYNFCLFAEMLDWLELIWFHWQNMARPRRIQYCGAVYHVMARGDHGQGIFGDDADRMLFLETLGEACGKTGWRIHVPWRRWG
jgi:hypothetical protein